MLRCKLAEEIPDMFDCNIFDGGSLSAHCTAGYLQSRCHLGPVYATQNQSINKGEEANVHLKGQPINKDTIEMERLPA